MDDLSGSQLQRWETSPEFPEDWIKTQYGAGFFITSVVYNSNAGLWAVVMTEVEDINHQAWVSNSTFPEDWIAEQYKNEAEITVAAGGQGLWIVVMSQRQAGQRQQAWHYDPESFPMTWVNEQYGLGTQITIMTSLENQWLVIMTAVSSDYFQWYFYNQETFPTTYVEERWPKDFSQDDAGFWITVLGTSVGGGLNVVQSQNVPFAESFDARTAWGASLDVLDQGSCGSCWSFATTGSLSDRLFVSGQTNSEVELSPQSLISCDTGSSGCDGGYEGNAFQWMIDHGVTTCSSACMAGCLPYVSGSCTEGKDSNHDGCTVCIDWCANGLPWTATYKAIEYTDVGVELAIQAELLINGPVSTCFSLYSSFYSFFNTNPDGIYTSMTGNSVGGHCVLIIGWGFDATSNQAYWTVRNSWGTKWADNGYFKIARGNNLANFESGSVAGYPANEMYGVQRKTATESMGCSKPAPATSTNDGIPAKSGGLWLQRSLTDPDVKTVVAHATARKPTAMLKGVASVKSQAVNGARYKITSGAGNVLSVLVSSFNSTEGLMATADDIVLPLETVFGRL